MQQKKSLTGSMHQIRELMSKGNSLEQSLELCGFSASVANELEDWQRDYLGLDETEAEVKTQIKTAHTTMPGSKDLSRARSAEQLDALRALVHDGDVGFEKALKMLNLPEEFLLRLDSWGLNFIANKRAQVLTKEVTVWGKKMDFRDLIEKREREEREEEQANLWK